MRWICLLVLFACGGDKAAEKSAPAPAPSPPVAEKPGIDAAPGTPASRSGAPPWLLDARQGMGACREDAGALDCSGSAIAKTREEGEPHALDAALAAMAEQDATTVDAIAAARGRQPDDVWWETTESGVVVYARARLSAEQRAAIKK